MCMCNRHYCREHLFHSYWCHPVQGMPSATLLGRAGDLVRSRARDIYASKVGGAPCFLSASDLPSEDLLRCLLCGQQLALVTQVRTGVRADAAWLFFDKCRADVVTTW